MPLVVNLDGVTIVVVFPEIEGPTAEDRTPSAVPKVNGRRGERSE
jgi:hypothetical protein